MATDYQPVEGPQDDGSSEYGTNRFDEPQQPENNDLKLDCHGKGQHSALVSTKSSEGMLAINFFRFVGNLDLRYVSTEDTSGNPTAAGILYCFGPTGTSLSQDVGRLRDQDFAKSFAKSFA